MKQRITVKIAQSEYPLEIESEDEEGVRAAALHINNEVESLQILYRDVDIKDLLSMVLLSEEQKLMDLESKSDIQINDTLRRLELIDARLGEYLLSR